MAHLNHAGAISIKERISRKRKNRQRWAAAHAKDANTGEMAKRVGDAEKGGVVPTDASSQEYAGSYLAANKVNKGWTPEGVRNGSET